MRILEIRKDSGTYPRGIFEFIYRIRIKKMGK